MTKLFDHPYAAFLANVDKPNRYTGAEYGVRRKSWPDVSTRVCLAFPEIYDIGMSHLGFRILYKLLNDHPDILAERAYAPWVDMQRELHQHGKLLVSHENARPLCDFDVVGFSLQFELTYTNVLGMLDLGGIPLRSSARSDADPLVIAGGPVATHAEPMAVFFDAILIGDGEEAATEIALAWTDGKKRGLSRQERLEALARIPGVYVPSLYSTALDAESGLEVVMAPTEPGIPFPIERRLVADLSKFPFPDDSPVGGPEAIFDRMSIEVARGCTEGCRFCQAGMIYRPVRERDPAEIINTVLSALKKSGQDEVSLTALSTADVSCISPLIKQLVEKTAPERVSLSVASLRAYGLAEDLLDSMRQVRASGLTFAPEAGTQRMRDVINKNVTEAQLMETAARVFSRGFDRMKLYFIIGLPTEEDVDVLGIVEVGKNALNVGKRVGKRPTVVVSVSTHVPKPHTPFQWCAQDSLEEMGRKQALLRNAVRGIKNLQLRLHDSKGSVLEGILARGDRRLGPVIEQVFLEGGRFDSWDEELRMDLWQKAFADFAVPTEAFLQTLPVTGRLPWDHLDIGLEQGFLLREYQKALKSRLSPPCGKVAGAFIHATNIQEAEAEKRKLVCYDCGIACDMGKMRTQRVTFLGKLGAKLPVLRTNAAAEREPNTQAPTTPAEAEEPKPKKPARRTPESYRPARSGGKPERFRLHFMKTGPAALLGHLDLMRELPRVLRRAGIGTAYSEGFHPKPEISCGPALALGIASLDEYVDCKLLDAPSEAELVARLNTKAAGGLRFLGALRLGPSDPRLARIITSGSYVAALPPTCLQELGGLQGIEQRIADFLGQEQVFVRRDLEGIGKNINVRAFVSDLRLGSSAARECLARAGLMGQPVPIEFAISIDPSGSARPREVVAALFGKDMPHQIVRTRISAGKGTPLELELHRQPTASVSDAPVNLTFLPAE